jgi:hypothetical protein
MKNTLIAAFAALFVACTSFCSAHADASLPACGSPDTIKSAVMLDIQEKTGVSNETLASVLNVDTVKPLGVDKTTDAKTCYVVLRCDTQKAKDLEKDVIGKRPLGQFCWSLNYLSDTGNGAMKFNVRPDGEGGFLIKMEESQGYFDQLWGIFRRQASAAPANSVSQNAAPQSAAPQTLNRNWVGQGPLVVRGDPSRITWQSLDSKRLIVYRVIVSSATGTEIFDSTHGLGNFPQSFRTGAIGWVDCIPNAIKVVIVTNRGTLEFKPSA